MVCSSHPRKVLQGERGANLAGEDVPSLHLAEEDVPSLQHAPFGYETPRPVEQGSKSEARTPPPARVVLYLQEDSPSPKPLTWLGAGCVSVPHGWTPAQRGAQTPSSTAGLPREPVCFRLMEETQQPKVSASLWNRSDAEVPPCRAIARHQREVKSRIASREMEIDGLFIAVKEASVAKKKVERELVTLDRRAWHDSQAGAALQQMRDIYGGMSRDLEEKERRHSECLRQVREHKLECQKLQDKISKVRNTSTHAALFQAPVRGCKDTAWRHGTASSGDLTLETRISPSPAMRPAGSSPTAAASPTSPSDTGSTQGVDLRSVSVARPQSRGRRNEDREGKMMTSNPAKGVGDGRVSPQPSSKAQSALARNERERAREKRARETREISSLSSEHQGSTRSVRSLSPAVGGSQRANDRQTGERQKETSLGRDIGVSQKSRSRTRSNSREPAHGKVVRGRSFLGPHPPPSLTPPPPRLVHAPRLPGFASRPVDEILRRRAPMLD